MYFILHYHLIIVNPFSLFQRFLVVLSNFIRRFLCNIFLFYYLYLCFKAFCKDKQKSITDFTSKQKERVCDLKMKKKKGAAAHRILCLQRPRSGAIPSISRSTGFRFLRSIGSMCRPDVCP